MRRLRPMRIVLIAFFMVLLGVIFPFLMVMHILESTYFLNFLSFTLSVAGLFLGLIGAAWYVRENKSKD